jgi:hypothetical protein
LVDPFTGGLFILGVLGSDARFSTPEGGLCPNLF